MENSSKHQKLYRLIGLQIIGMLLGKKLDCSYVTRAFRESYIVGFRSKFTAIRREWQHWIEPLPILWQNCWEPNISISGSVSTQQSFFCFALLCLLRQRTAVDSLQVFIFSWGYWSSSWVCPSYIRWWCLRYLLDLLTYTTTLRAILSLSLYIFLHLLATATMLELSKVRVEMMFNQSDYTRFGQHSPVNITPLPTPLQGFKMSGKDRTSTFQVCGSIFSSNFLHYSSSSRRI